MQKTLVRCCFALAAAVPLAGIAQEWSARPVKVISTFTPGSPADALMRMIAGKMSDALPQPVVVEVNAGAGGLVGAGMVARSAPDGHMFLYTVATTLVVTPHLVKNQPYALKDFTPIEVVSKAVTCMSVSTSFPANNMKEFIAYAKANPGKVAYGTNGIGGLYHLQMALIAAKYGLDIVHVPYKGGTNALQAVVAGTLPVGFSPVAQAIPQARAGKVKILGILDTVRSPDVPDLPAMGEQLPDYEKIGSGVDVYGPAGIPVALQKRIHAELDKAASLPDVRQKMKDIAFPYDGLALQEMAATRVKDVEVAARAIKAAGLKPE